MKCGLNGAKPRWWGQGHGLDAEEEGHARQRPLHRLVLAHHWHLDLCKKLCPVRSDVQGDHGEVVVWVRFLLGDPSKCCTGDGRVCGGVRARCSDAGSVEVCSLNEQASNARNHGGSQLAGIPAGHELEVVNLISRETGGVGVLDKNLSRALETSIPANARAQAVGMSDAPR